MISVITTSYMRTGGLLGAINSVDRQTYTDWEHIIVSDAWDGVRDVAGVYPDDRRSVVVLSDRANDFGMTPLNEGIKLATGEWIAVLADDNQWQPEFLEDLLDLANRNPDASFVYGGTEKRRKHGGKREFRFHPWPTWTQIDLGECLYKRSLFDTYGLYSEWGESSYDWVKIQEFLTGGEKWVGEKQFNFIFMAVSCESRSLQKTTEPVVY